MSAPGSNVSIRFDALNNLSPVLKTMTTDVNGFKTTVTNLKGEFVKLGPGGGGLTGALAGFNRPLQQVEAQTTSLSTKLRSLGSSLASNATSFGVAGASIWGVYNAYDNLIKIQLRAEAATNRANSLETTLASLITRRDEALVKGNLSAAEMAILNDRITDTQAKLATQQVRAADLQGDVNEAFAAFATTVGPQVIAAGGSIVQLVSNMQGSFTKTGGIVNTLKNAFTGLIPGLASARKESLILSPALGGMATNADKATGRFASLKNAMGGVGASGALLGAGLVALGGFLIALGLDVYNTQKRIGELKAEFTLLEKGSEAAFRNMAEQAATFNKSLVGQIGGALAGANTTIFGTKPILGFNFTEVFKNRFQEDVSTIRADLVKAWNDAMNSPEMKNIGILPPSAQASIKANMQKILAFIKSDTNWKDAAHTITTIDIAKPIAEGITTSLETIPQMIFPKTGKSLVDLKAFFGEQTKKDIEGAKLVFESLKESFRTGAIPVEQWGEAITTMTGFLIDAKPEFAGREQQIASLANTMAKDMVSAEEDVIQKEGELAKAAASAQIARENEVKSITDTATAYLGLSGVQGKSVGQMQVLNGVMEGLIAPANDLMISIQSIADTDKIATQATFDFVNSLYDNAAAMVNLNKINDGSVTSLAKLRQAWLNGLTSVQEFITTTKLQHVTTETARAALEDYIRTTDKIDIPPGLHLTLEELQKLHQQFVETGDGVGALAQTIEANLEPALQRLSSLFGAKTFKDMKTAFGELELGDIGEGMEKRLLKIIEPLRKIAEHGREAANIFSLLTQFGDAMTEKDYAKWLGELSDRLGDIKKQKGVEKPIVDFVNSIKTMSPEELQANAGAIEFLTAALADNGKLDVGEQAEFLTKFGDSAGGMAPNVDTAAKSVRNLAKEMANIGRFNQILQESKQEPPGVEEEHGGRPDEEGKITKGKGGPFAGIIQGVDEAKAKIEELRALAAQPIELNIDGFLSALAAITTFGTTVIKLVATMVKSVVGSVSVMAKSSSTLISAMAQGSANVVFAMVKGIVAVVNGMKNSAITSIGAMAKTGVSVTASMAKSMVSSVGQMAASIVSSASKAASSFSSSMSKIVSSANSAKSAVNSLKSAIGGLQSKTITITTRFRTVGSPPGGRARGGVEYSATSRTTLWGEGGPEIAAFFPLRSSGQPRKGDYDIVVPSPTLDTSGIQSAIGKGLGQRGGSRGGPTHIHITIPVYLTEGLPVIKKFVKDIVLEDVGIFPTT